MPWKETTRMSEREEMVILASSGMTTMAALSQRYGVSRKTAYKWLRRYAEVGSAGLKDLPRRPRRSPGRTSAEAEKQVLDARQAHPAWGGRKLHHWLVNSGVNAVPAPSTITDILRRNGGLAEDRRRQRDWQSFEAEGPNVLWQMDFKGHFPVGTGRCHPLTVLDDHSRFNIVLSACANEQAETVKAELTQAFQRYGLPQRMLMDNGSPWGSELVHPHTHLTAWLIRLGITVSHGRPYHPQTQGKEERFHRTLTVEVIGRRPSWTNLPQVQDAFTPWRDVYNLERPHEALGNRPPITRYCPSPRAYPLVLPTIDYSPDDEVRKVQDKGRISFRGREFLVSRAFIGEPVGLRCRADGLWDVYYCHQRVGQVALQASAQITDHRDQDL